MSRSFHYGVRAVEMLKELKSQGRLLDNPVNEESRQAVIAEINQLFDNVQKQMTEHTQEELSEMNLRTSLMMQYSSILRNKRCLLAYMMERARLIKNLRWDLATENPPEEIMQALTPHERDFHRKYNEILRQYMMDDLDLDLTLNLQQPPFTLSVEVRVLRDLGDIVTLSGQSVVMKKNSVISLSREDAEPLIAQGLVQHIVDTM